MVFMPKAKVAGASLTCPTCATDGITVIIHAVESEYQGQKKLSWKNPDGSGHVKKQDDGTWTHTQPMQHQETITKLSKTISPENQEKVAKMYASLNESGEADSFAVLYMALRNKFMEYIDEPDVRTAGQICGNMLTNYLQTHNIPVDFVKASSMSAETSESKTLIHNFGLANSSSHKGSFAAQGRELDSRTVEDNVRWVRLNFPSFSDKMSANEKIIIYLKSVYGIELPTLPIPLETITREFRHQSEFKKLDEEQKKREEYINKQCAGNGSSTVDRGLLL